MSLRITLLSLLLPITFTAACGDPDSGPITAAAAEAPCRTLCERDLACSDDGPDVDACTAGCVDDIAGWARTDAVEGYADCVADASCSDEEWLDCLLGCEPLDAHAAYEAGCREALAGCRDPENIDELCEVTPGPANGGLLCLITPEVVDEMTACFDGGPACEAAIDCVDEVIAAAGIDL
jgi:hypothetical protein